MLFIIYINDLETGINSDIGKFADDIKIGRLVKNIDDAKILQDDLNSGQSGQRNGRCSLMITSVAL